MPKRAPETPIETENRLIFENAIAFGRIAVLADNLSEQSSGGETAAMVGRRDRAKAIGMALTHKLSEDDFLAFDMRRRRSQRSAEFWQGVDAPTPEVSLKARYEWTVSTLEKFINRPVTTTDLTKIIFAEELKNGKLTNLLMRVNKLPSSPVVNELLEAKGLELIKIPANPMRFVCRKAGSFDEILHFMPASDEELRDLAVDLREKELGKKRSGHIIRPSRRKNDGAGPIADARNKRPRVQPIDRNAYIERFLQPIDQDKIESLGLELPGVNGDFNKIVKLLADGKKILSIADRLGITHSDIKNELAPVMINLKARTPAHLIRKIIRENNGIRPYQEGRRVELSKEQLIILQDLSFGARTAQIFEATYNGMQKRDPAKIKAEIDEEISKMFELFGVETQAGLVYQGFETCWLGSESDGFVAKREQIICDILAGKKPDLGSISLNF